MANFVTDNGDLPAPKTDLNTLDSTKKQINYVIASDWNITRQAILDIKDFLRGSGGAGGVLGLVSSATDPAPAGITNYLWLKTDNTLWLTISGVAIPVGGGVGGSLAISVAAFPVATTNLSTVGTFDWFWPGSGGPSNPVPSWSNQNSINFHWKKGGELYKSVVWFGAGASSAPGTFPGTTTFTSTASDDSYAAALSATDGSYLIVAGAAGFQVNIAASTVSRTLRIYCGAKSVTATITAAFEDGSASPVSATFNAATGVNEQRAVDIVFKAGSSTRLRVTVTSTTLNGGVQAIELWGMAEF